MGKNNGKTISKISSDKYGQKLLDHAKQSATDSDRKSRKSFTKNSCETNEEKINKEWPELRQTIIDDLRLI